MVQRGGQNEETKPTRPGERGKVSSQLVSPLNTPGKETQRQKQEVCLQRIARKAEDTKTQQVLFCFVFNLQNCQGYQFSIRLFMVKEEQFSNVIFISTSVEISTAPVRDKGVLLGNQQLSGNAGGLIYCGCWH